MSLVEDTNSVALSHQEPDDQKLQELILYISWMCEDDPTFGATKLNKILFFADFHAYAQLGKSITGQEYRALDQGPAPRHLIPVRSRLVENGDIAVRKRDFYGKTQDRTIALRAPNFDGFAPQEIAIVDRVIQDWRGKSTREMSAAAHEFIGWKLALPNETIPYETALFQWHEPTSGELRQGAELEQLARDYLSELSH